MGVADQCEPSAIRFLRFGDVGNGLSGNGLSRCRRRIERRQNQQSGGKGYTDTNLLLPQEKQGAKYRRATRLDWLSKLFQLSTPALFTPGQHPAASSGKQRRKAAN